MEITGQRIVVTGAASGIGRALLDAFSGYDCRILAVDRDAQGLSRAFSPPACQGVRATYCGDIGSHEGVDGVFDAAQRLIGGVDIFVANAGFAYYERLAQPSWERLEALYRVNTLSPIYAAVKMARCSRGRPYRVVVVASAMALLALPGYALYSSSKAALDRFAEAYRLELPDPRSLVMVYPIGTRTGFFAAAAARSAPKTWPTQSPEAVARAIIRGIKRDRTSIHPSALFRTFMLLDRIFPLARRIEQAIEGRRFRRWLALEEGHSVRQADTAGAERQSAQ